MSTGKQTITSNARHIGYRSDVKNNIGNLFRQLGKYQEAHDYVAEARRLASSVVKDRVRVAQFDDTLAQLLIDEERFVEAETVARRSVSMLEKTDHECLLADSLITHGITLARLPDQKERASFTLQRASEVAQHVGAYNKAGLASLTLIEELEDSLTPEVLSETYIKASHWLSEFQSIEVQVRLNAAARKVLAAKSQAATGKQLFQPCNLHEEVLKFEGSIIRRALVAVNGRVSSAAALLTITRQGLAAMINTRHPELLKVRTAIRRR